MKAKDEECFALTCLVMADTFGSKVLPRLIRAAGSALGVMRANPSDLASRVGLTEVELAHFLQQAQSEPVRIAAM